MKSTFETRIAANMSKTHELSPSTPTEENAHVTALRAARVATFVWDVAARSVSWVDSARLCFPAPAGTAHDVDIDFLLEQLSDEDRDRARAAITAATDTDEPARTPCRPAPGRARTTRHLELAAVSTRDARGELERVVGALIDVSEHERLEAALTEATERYRLALHNGNVGMLVTDLAAGVNEVDAVTTAMYGMTREEMSAMNFDKFILSVDPRDRQHVADVYDRAFRAAHTDRGAFRFTKPSGEVVWLSSTAHVEFDPPGVPARVVIATIDLTELKRTEQLLEAQTEALRSLNVELERRVSDRTRELQSAVKELESFSYSVSHDLRAPLRAMNSFSHALLTDHGSSLPESGRELLHAIRDGAVRMSELIDDLLEFSKLGRAQLRKQPFVMSQLVAECLKELAPSHNQRDVRITVADLPNTDGDRSLLRQVWLNLLSNAIKYTGKCAVAEVSVQTDQVDGETVYSVKDNGAGFDMRYAHKLFGVFRRLHRAEDYEGTGVGLAIVHRIIERHGGRIWVDAARDKGATFFFTLAGKA